MICGPKSKLLRPGSESFSTPSEFQPDTNEVAMFSGKKLRASQISSQNRSTVIPASRINLRNVPGLSSLCYGTESKCG